MKLKKKSEFPNPRYEQEAEAKREREKRMEEMNREIASANDSTRANSRNTNASSGGVNSGANSALGHHRDLPEAAAGIGNINKPKVDVVNPTDNINEDAHPENDEANHPDSSPPEGHRNHHLLEGNHQNQRISENRIGQNAQQNGQQAAKHQNPQLQHKLYQNSINPYLSGGQLDMDRSEIGGASFADSVSHLQSHLHGQSHAPAGGQFGNSLVATGDQIGQLLSAAGAGSAKLTAGGAAGAPQGKTTSGSIPSIPSGDNLNAGNSDLAAIAGPPADTKANLKAQCKGKANLVI
jgi:hypothetical protein